MPRRLSSSAHSSNKKGPPGPGCKDYNYSACSRVKCPQGTQKNVINNVCVCSRGTNTVYSGCQSKPCGNPAIVYGKYKQKHQNSKRICCPPGSVARFGANPYCFGCLRGTNPPSRVLNQMRKKA